MRCKGPLVWLSTKYPVKSHAREGWGKTKRAISKRLHYFADERALCSGSAARDAVDANIPQS